MKLAFYYLLVGDAALPCFRYSLYTLRAQGWQGEVFVLTERERQLGIEPDAYAHNVQQIVVPSEVFNLDPEAEGPYAEIDIRRMHNVNPYKFTITALTPYIDRFVDLSSYDYIVFLDADNLVAKPVDVLIAYLKSCQGRFVISTREGRQGRAGKLGLPNAANLTRFERFLGRFRQAIGTDFFAVPGNDLGRRILADWRQECLKGYHGDQAAFQAIYLRRYRRQVEVAPFDIHGFGLSKRAYQRTPEALRPIDSAIVHMQGAIREPEAFHAYYERYVAPALAQRHARGEAGSRGVVYICTGATYIRAAARSAQSVKATSPGLGCHLFADLAQAGVAESELLAPFDATTDIGTGHARSKVDWLPESPFARTLYLDSDTEVQTDINDVFDLLERFDIALAHAHARNRKLTHEVWTKALPDAFPQYNGGVIAYRQSPAVQQLLQAWRDAYHRSGFRKDQVTLRELLWDSDVRLATLPPEYNIRYEKYLDIWAETEAKPRILHLARFHDEAGEAQAASAGPSC